MTGQFSSKICGQRVAIWGQITWSEIPQSWSRFQLKEPNSNPRNVGTKAELLCRALDCFWARGMVYTCLSERCAIAPLQEGLKRCLVSMKWTGCFAPATFLVQSRGWTRCPQVFSIFSFYNCGINVQRETSLPDVLLALSLGTRMLMWDQPLS